MNGAPERRGFELTPQIFVGFALLLIGTLFAIDTLGIAHTERYVQFWPAIIVVFGLLKLVQARGGPGLVAGGFWIVVGSWLLADNLGFDVPDVWEAWPVFLVFAGLALIWQGLRRRSEPRRPDGESDAKISMLAIMAGVTRRSVSKAFQGGEATAVMGGCEIDLRQATLAPEGATLDIFAFWGGIEIRVPPGWHVDNRLFALMAGAEDTTKGGTTGGPRFTVRGLVLMGGVEIKN
jgi:hypothetical protein